jgi:hypothetical protein
MDGHVTLIGEIINAHRVLTGEHKAVEFFL